MLFQNRCRLVLLVLAIRLGRSSFLDISLDIFIIQYFSDLFSKGWTPLLEQESLNWLPIE